MNNMEQVVSPEMFEEMFGASAIMSLISTIPSFLFSLAVYIFTAYSLYTIANRRGLKNPWLAWIPLVQVWTLGAIADDYRMAVAGEKKNRRKILLGTNIAIGVLGILMIVICIVMVVGLLTNMAPTMGEIPNSMASTLGIGVAGVVLFGLPIMVLAIIHAVFTYIALYDVFRSCDPGNAVLYLVLSIFVNICQPIFLFLCRNKDDGMPQPQPEIPPAVWPSEEETEEEN